MVLRRDIFVSDDKKEEKANLERTLILFAASLRYLVAVPLLRGCTRYVFESFD